MTKQLNDAERQPQPEPRQRKSEARRRLRSAPRLRPLREDQEFLPADLEILEQPPSPVRMALILLIGALVVISIGWSWVGHIEIIATAQGKIQPTGRVKIIQPLETGKIAAIHVENGRSVKAGDDLVELDHGDAEADETAASAALVSSRAEAIRRQTAITAAEDERLFPPPQITWDTDIPPAVRSREERVLRNDLSQLASAVASLDAQAHQKQVERDRLDETMQLEKELLATLSERVDMRIAMVASAGGSRSSVIDSLETMQTQRTTLATQKSQRDIAIANLEVLRNDRDKTIKSFIEENSQKLAEAQRQAEDLTQKQAKAHLRMARMTLKSPIDGTVLGLSVTTVGQVVTSGEELMRVVPDDATLEIESYLPNKDIGFVKPGQTAIIKIESFPFTRYGTITADIVRVAHDAIPEPDAQQSEASGIKPQKSSFFAGAQRTQNLVFPVTLKLNRTTINIDGQSVALKPGMAVSVEVATGRRRILEYFFSPLVEVASQAIKER